MRLVIKSVNFQSLKTIGIFLVDVLKKGERGKRDTGKGGHKLKGGNLLC